MRSETVRLHRARNRGACNCKTVRIEDLFFFYIPEAYRIDALVRHMYQTVIPPPSASPPQKLASLSQNLRIAAWTRAPRPNLLPMDKTFSVYPDVH